MVLDGPADSICFAGVCAQFLAPQLRPGDLVALDNLSSHRSTAVTTAIEAVQAKAVYLPPYSPDLNPIENIFAKLRQIIRGLRPLNWMENIKAARRALRAITLDELLNAFAHCGYESQ